MSALRNHIWNYKKHGSQATRERAILWERHSVSPHTLEAVEVERRHLAVWNAAKAKYRRMRRRDAVSVLIDEQLVIGVIDRAVQHCLMQADLYVQRLGHQSVQGQRLLDLGRRGILDIFFAVLGGV